MPLASRPLGRQIRPSVEQLLDREVDALDGLMAEIRLGIRNQRHFDELEERATGIGARLRGAFRTGEASSGR